MIVPVAVSSPSAVPPAVDDVAERDGEGLVELDRDVAVDRDRDLLV